MRSLLLALLVAAVACLVGAPRAAEGRVRAFAPPPPREPSREVLERRLAGEKAMPDDSTRVVVNRMEPEEARRRARTTLGGLPGYAGYVAVNDECDSEIFFWAFLALNGNRSAPTAAWQQGGPGGSSMFGLFGENGPFSVSDSLELVPRNVTWARNLNMVYIDQPVGTGFSRTNVSRPGCLRTNMDGVATDYYAALQGFFAAFPEFLTSEFYVTGESYAGKYIPAIGARILEANARISAGRAREGEHLVVPLRGVAIGDGLTDPATQVTGYSTVAYAFGIADLNQRDHFEQKQLEMVSLIKAANWSGCVEVFESLVDGPPDYFSNISGSTDYYDLRILESPDFGGPYGAFLALPSTHEALHTGSYVYNSQDDAAAEALNDDICRTELPDLTTLLEDKDVRVLLYNGQFDFIVAPATTEIMLTKTEWSGLNKYLAAPRGIWRLKDGPAGNVAGYVRDALGLTQIIVRQAGHLTPADQPARAFDMITRFVNREPFF